MYIYAEWSLKTREVAIRGPEQTFLCVVGLNINGPFVAIRDRGISIELFDHNDIEHNSNRIFTALHRANFKKDLPSNNTALRELAHDLACVFDTIIRQLKETD